MSRIRRARAAIALGVAVHAFVREWRGSAGFTSATWSSDDPWAVPAGLYERIPDHQRVPVLWRVLRPAWRPLRVYLRIGDEALFRLWWMTRRPVYWLADVMGEDAVVAGWNAEARRAAVNAELRRRDDLGIAPDGGSFDAS